MTQENTDPTKRELTKFYRMSLYTVNPETQKNHALSWSCAEGTPKVTVFFDTNDPNDKLFINIPINASNILGVFEQFERIIANKEEDMFLILAKVPKWVDRKKTDEKIPAGVLCFGKDKEGMLYFSMKDEGKPLIKFTLDMTEWYCLFHGNGKQFTPGEASEVAARGYLAILKDLYLKEFEKYMLMPYKKNLRAPTYITNNPAPTSGDDFIIDDLKF